MSWHDDYDEYGVPNTWSEKEYEIYDSLVGGDVEIGSDRHLQLLFDGAKFADGLTPFEREGVQRALEEYLEDEYGIYFDDWFDWESWREWYEGQAA